METSQLSESAPIIDHKMDSAETEVAENSGLLEEVETVESSAEFSESTGIKETAGFLENMSPWTVETDEQHSLENGRELDILYHKEALILDTECNYLNRTESMTSSVSDTPSSAETVCENELHKTQDQTDQEQSGTPVLPNMEDDEEGYITKTPEPETQEAEVEDFTQSKSQVSMLEGCIREEAPSDISTELCHDFDPDDPDLNTILRVEIDAVSSDSDTDEKWRAIFSSSINKEDDDTYMDDILKLSAQELFVQKVERKVERFEETNQQADVIPDYMNPLEHHKEHSEYDFESQDQLEHCIEYEFQTQDHPEDHTKYGFEIQEQPENNTEYEFESQEHPEDHNKYGFEMQEQPENHTEYEFESQEHPEDYDKYRSDTQEQPKHHTEHKFESQEHPGITSLFHGLSKISEDDEEVGHSSKHSMHTSNSMKVNTGKKLPHDYCVIQEMKSENVSTEHVDFQVARNQWLKLEEETKFQIHQPKFRQSTCQGGHNSMYTPVRNIDRSKKEPEVECTALNEYSHTHFSPCSEDSGLDDSSYRSPCDDTETPIEREIRLALEREESLRRERGICRPTDVSECMQATMRPVILLPGKCDRRLSQEVDERRKVFEMKEEECRLPSPSVKTPSFIITSSPSKSQLYHEVSENNVIIVEPDDYSSGSMHGAEGTPQVTMKTSDWPSDTSNVIILETPSVIIRSSSEFCLNSTCQESQESTFLNNPFFKLRSRSTQSLIDEEIKMVRQREEELKRQRENLYAKDEFNAVLMSPTLLDNLAFDKSELPVRCKSSPSSPMKSAYRTNLSENKANHLCS